LQYLLFAEKLMANWLEYAEFSYGLLIPLIVGYLIWMQREELKKTALDPWAKGILVVGLGCAVQVLASRTGSLVFSGLALVISLMGITSYLWGRKQLRIVAVPLTFLILMVPLPSYLMVELSWKLKVLATSVSAEVLRWFSIPVYQDGTFLRLPNYILEIKQACTGSRSIFALFALAVVLAYLAKTSWRNRLLLVAAAPVLAVSTNIIRIVGTGLIARKYGNLVADESLHAAWGVAVFLLAVLGLLGVQKVLLWTSKEYA
jgi:exosortase